MKKKSLFFVLFCIVLAFQSVNAQDIEFEYDAAGNCIVKYKTIVLAPSRVSAPPNDDDDDDNDTMENTEPDEDEILEPLFSDWLNADTTENIKPVENKILVPSFIEDMIGTMKITISPNPTKGIVQINFGDKDTGLKVDYSITEMNGKYLTGGISTDNPLVLDFGVFPKGIYLLRIIVNDKKETYKIIKQ